MAKTSATVEKWHAVSVVGGTRACAASLRLKGLRFLSAEAPRIPLGDCTMPGGCNCVYRHFADRRARERRVPTAVSTACRTGPTAAARPAGARPT